MAPAMDFPANPTNGQVYGNYVYSTSTGAWNAKPITGKVTTSPTAPATPSNGDEWFNTNDGTLYIYYVDVDGGQWVESSAPISANGYYSPNYIINGAFDIWQRGTGLATATSSTSGFVSDRWQMWRAGYATGGSTYKPAGPTGFESAARVQRDAGNTSTALISISQSIESSMSIPLAGQTVTLSFYARAGANFSASSSVLNPYIISGTGSNQNIAAGFTGYANTATANSTLTASWQRFSITGTVSSSATQLAVQFSYTPVGTAGANDYFEITGVQLEQGSVATPFRRNANSIQGELAACQRYYFQSPTIGGAWYSGLTFTDIEDSSWGGTVWPSTMRATPTVVLYADSNAPNTVRSYGGYAARNVTGYIGTAVNLNFIYHDGGYTVGRPYAGQFTASAEI